MLEALKAGKEPPAMPHEEVSIFFSDIVGYTVHCSRMQTHEVRRASGRAGGRAGSAAAAAARPALHAVAVRL